MQYIGQGQKTFLFDHIQNALKSRVTAQQMWQQIGSVNISNAKCKWINKCCYLKNIDQLITELRTLGVRI